MDPFRSLPPGMFPRTTPPCSSVSGHSSSAILFDIILWPAVGKLFRLPFLLRPTMFLFHLFLSLSSRVPSRLLPGFYLEGCPCPSLNGFPTLSKASFAFTNVSVSRASSIYGIGASRWLPPLPPPKTHFPVFRTRAPTMYVFSVPFSSHLFVRASLKPQCRGPIATYLIGFIRCVTFLLGEPPFSILFGLAPRPSQRTIFLFFELFFGDWTCDSFPSSSHSIKFTRALEDGQPP